MREFEKTKPSYAVPEFITFMRAPHVTAFELPAANDQKPVTFAAVNAHLIYGRQSERDTEFKALINWLSHRLQDEARMSVDNFILMGDLNLNFDKPTKDRIRIETQLKALNKDVFGHPDQKRIYFPFIDREPLSGKNIRTNARNSQTFDHIAFFLGSAEKQLPNDEWRSDIKKNQPDGFQYNVFNFTELFSMALLNKSFTRLKKDEKKAFGKKFEHSVSDHMPIWVRIPRPGFT